MTESDWLTSMDPQAVLAFLQGSGRVSQRKLRLFAVACCQRLLRTVRLHAWYAHGLAVAERFADGEATVEELEQVRHYPCADWCLQHASGFDPDEAAAAGQSYRVTNDPSWLTWNDGTVTLLAQAAYEHRHLPSGQLDPGRLAVLADALTDAGCADAVLLDHLRGPGPHVRGCVVVDLLNGRE